MSRDAARDGSRPRTEATIDLRLGSLHLDVHLRVEPGEVLAVQGPNGAGKTTSLRVLAGLQAVDHGRVVVGGSLVDDPGADVFTFPEQRRVGVVFQDHLLFPHLDLTENVAFGLRSRGVRRAEARARAAEWLGRVGLRDYLQARPGEVSGGQAQRAALARALITDPDLLLLDEPLASLDTETRATLRTELRSHLDGFAGGTVLVTHDRSDADTLADRIVTLDRGRLTGERAPDRAHPRPGHT